MSKSKNLLKKLNLMEFNYDANKEHTRLFSSISSSIRMLEYLKNTVDDEWRFLDAVRTNDRYADAIEEKINELKKDIDEIEFAFTAISNWAYQERKKK
jgi:hypothetical protein